MVINYMPPKILFNLFGVDIHSYGLMLMLGFVFFIGSFLFLVKKRKLDLETGLISIVLAMLGGVFGARFFYVLFNGGFDADLISYFAVWDGGLAFQGGVFGAVLLMVFYFYMAKKDIWKYLDIMAVSIFALYAIKRIGCFLNWDDYGVASNLPWAIKVGNDVARHPTQLYSSLFAFITFIVFFKMYDQNKPKRFMSGMFLIVYGLFRFLIEFIRVNPRVFWIFTVPQLVSILGIVIGIVILKYDLILAKFKK